MALAFDAGAVLCRLLVGGLPEESRSTFGDWAIISAILPRVTPWRFRLALAAGGAGELTAEEAEAALLVALEVIEAYRDRPGHATGALTAAVPFVTDALTAAANYAAGLVVADELAGRLPLLELATEVAELQPGRLLVVNHAPLRRSCAGLCGLYTADRCAGRAAGVVLLDAGLADAELRRAWAHELAHAMDCRLEVVPPLGREAFADALGPLLLELAPGSAAAALPLIASVEAATALQRPTWPRIGDLADLIEFAVTAAKASALG